MVEIDKIRKSWKEVKTTSGFKKTLTFLVFVAIAALFWFILAMNDNVQDDFEVGVNIYNVPDSVNFINLPPDKIHVMVRDKGSNLWRSAVLGTAKMNINFRDYSADGVFRMSKSELNAAIKNAFGQTASLLSTSVDSLVLAYTNLPGRRIPVEVSADLRPAVGKIIMGVPQADPKGVMVYANRDVLDTITRVFTERFTRNNLEESTDITVKLTQVSGARFDPSVVTVKVNVEPLVRKEVNVTVQIHNVPDGMDLLLFPANAQVEYYVPMSKFNAASTETVEVIADYRDLAAKTRRLPLHLGRRDRNLLNLRVLSDSVEYTLVRE